MSGLQVYPERLSSGGINDTYAFLLGVVLMGILKLYT